MGLNCVHIHRVRPLATTRVDNDIFGTHSQHIGATRLLSQLLFEVLHVPEAIIEVVVVLNANTFVFLCDLLG